jgi:hypothetical protein
MQHRHVDGYNTAAVMDQIVLTDVHKAQRAMSCFKKFHSNRKKYKKYILWHAA